MVEPVPDAFLESQVHPAISPLTDTDGEVASLVQEGHSVNVGQPQLKTNHLSLALHCTVVNLKVSSGHNSIHPGI